MSLLLALVLTAPPSCDALWESVWKAYAERELKGGAQPPLFEKLPDARVRLARAWKAECSRFSAEALDCARGVALEKELAALRAQLEREKVPPKEVEQGLAKLRAQWRITECRAVDRALDDAAAAVARDAGL
jgi:hypothetical protein